jgi:hypothetical protein
MTQEERPVLQTLDGILRSEKVRAQIQPIVERVRADLARKPDALMTWEPVPMTTFGHELPPEIRSGWVFILRAGVDTGAERHPNSHQRMMTFDGIGDMKMDVKAPNDVTEESEIAWQSHILVCDPNAPLERRWISIPKNVWHRPVIPKGAEWVVVSFHTVPAEELIEERPGAKQMRYESERKAGN